jgi:hypothetical protein
MAKIARKHQKIFGGDLTATNNIAEFGSLAEGTPEYSDDPDLIQVRTAYGNGLASAIIGNFAPALQDFNALFFLITRQLAYLFQAGVTEWCSTTSYYIGSIAHDGLGVLYMSLSDTNLNQAFTVASKWMPLTPNAVYTEIRESITYDVNNSDYLILVNEVGGYDHGAPYFHLPIPSALNAGRTVIFKQIKSPHNGNSRIYAIDDSTIDGAAYIELTALWQSKSFTSNGTNWFVSKVYP